MSSWRWHRNRAQRPKWRHESDFDEVRDLLLAKLSDKGPVTVADIERAAEGVESLTDKEARDAVWLMIASRDLVMSVHGFFGVATRGEESDEQKGHSGS